MATPFQCTKETPWHEGATPAQTVHVDAKEIRQRDGYPGGDIVLYECPNCGKRFEVELPQ
jgi:hypothetical protein